MTMMMMNEMMTFAQLDAVSGGGWGRNNIHDQAVYNSYGVETDWTYSPFGTDDFFYTEPGGTKRKINDETATAICFYKATADASATRNGVMIRDAVNYKAAHVDEYKKWLKGVNA